MPRYLDKPSVDGVFNPKAQFPFKISIDDVRATIESSHELLRGLNTYLVDNNHPRFEEMMLGNAFAGFLSEILVKNLSDRSLELTRNRKIGGYPDLISKGKYLEDQVLRGEGLEVKTSKQHSGWQGHNPEEGWLMIFVYALDSETHPVENRQPTEFTQVFVAKLNREDWSFSGRKGDSRRTITASIVKSGMLKLRSNWVYRKQPAQTPLN